MTHILSNKLTSEQQHGLKPKRSCVKQLLEVPDNWPECLDANIPVDIIYLGFSTAFDTASHDGLVVKLQALDIRGTLLNWIQNCLAGVKCEVV